MKFQKKIACIGAGYVGGPTMAVIANKCRDIKVTVVDIDHQKIAAWQSSSLPIYEPGLDEIVRAQRDKNLFFSTEIEKVISEADIVFIAVGTPTKTFGHGAGYAPDLQYVENCARTIASVAKGNTIVVEKSTVPVRTAETVKTILATAENDVRFQVLSNPEFLAEGSAIHDLLNPDRVLIGGQETPAGKTAIEELASIYATWVPRDRILTTNVWSSELAKLAANYFLAMRVASINAFAALCEKTGADINEIARAIGMDNRIGPRFLQASVGFGGSCFEKDILNLAYLCRHFGLHEVATYLEDVVTINNYQKSRFSQLVIKSLFNTVATKKIAVFGFAFKANTNDTRNSPAIDVCRNLLAEHAHLAIYDPGVSANQILADLNQKPEKDSPVEICPDTYSATMGAHAVLILTEWPAFTKLDYQRIFKSMTKPPFIFDGRNILDHQALFDIGFNVYPIGKRPLTYL